MNPFTAIAVCAIIATSFYVLSELHAWYLTIRKAGQNAMLDRVQSALPFFIPLLQQWLAPKPGVDARAHVPLPEAELPFGPDKGNTIFDTTDDIVSVRFRHAGLAAFDKAVLCELIYIPAGAEDAHDVIEGLDADGDAPRALLNAVEALVAKRKAGVHPVASGRDDA